MLPSLFFFPAVSYTHLYTEADAQSLNDIVYFIAFECFVPHGLLYIDVYKRQENAIMNGITSYASRAKAQVVGKMKGLMSSRCV